MFIAKWSCAQDPMFSQFYNAPLHLNPAFAGNTFGPKVAINYRNQWPGLPSAYQTYAASYDQFFNTFNSGIGFAVLADEAGNGVLKTNRASFTYAYAINLGNNQYLKIGIEPSIRQSRINWQKLIFGDQIDNETGAITPGGSNIPGTEVEPDNTNRIYFDVGVGGVYYNKIFYTGFSLKHLNAPDIQFIESGKSESIRGVPVRSSFHAGAQIYTPSLNIRRNKAYISPQILYVYQNPTSQLLIGALLDIGVMSVGSWYRYASTNGDAFILSAGFEKDFFRIEYSYDITVSSLAGTGGAHEIGIVMTFEDRNRPTKYSDCFEIFR